MSKNSLLFVFCLVVFLFNAFIVKGQQNVLELDEKIITIKMNKVPLGVALGYLMENYDVPIGFEQSNLDENLFEFKFSANSPVVSNYRIKNIGGTFEIVGLSSNKELKYPITISAENKKLEEVLDIIIKQIENYDWKLIDGVINIFPLDNRNEKFKELLELDIKDFSFEKGETVEDITMKLKSLPEFNQFLSKHNLKFNNWVPGPSGALEAQNNKIINQEMNFSNLKFRDLLNKITNIKRGAWILRWKDESLNNGKQVFSLDI